MSDRTINRGEAAPRLTVREHWGQYAAGIATEVAFVAVLTVVGLGLAAVAMVIWR